MKDRILNYIKIWKHRCYHKDIPDFADKNLEKLCKVPSYRMICYAILNNDIQLESLGYSRKKM